MGEISPFLCYNNAIGDSMKKRFIIIGAICLLFIIIGIFCYSRDNIRLKLSYELINHVELSNNKKIKVDIPINNNVKYIKSGKELINVLTTGNGIVYIGYETCPWCRNALPVLIDSIISNDVKNFYYFNIHDVSAKDIKDKLYEILDSYLKVTNDGKKVLAVPDVYAIKDGKIVGHHRGCVDGYNNPYRKMNDEQLKDLKNIYDEMIKEIK